MLGYSQAWGLKCLTEEASLVQPHFLSYQTLIPQNYYNKLAYNFLKKSLPEHAIGAWFEPLKPVEFSGNKLILEVPNQFFCEWIDSHYKKHLLTALNQKSKEKIPLIGL